MDTKTQEAGQNCIMTAVIRTLHQLLLGRDGQGMQKAYAWKRQEIQNKILIVNPEEKKALIRSAAEMKEFFLYPLRLD